MNSTDLHHVYRGASWALIVRGVLALALGVFILVRPLASVGAFALLVALWALIGGLIEVVHAFQLKPAYRSWWLLLISGLIGVAFGVLALILYPTLSLLFAVTWVSLWLLISGLLGTVAAVHQKRVGLHWGWTMGWAVLSVVAGVLAWISLSATLAAIMGLIAAFAIISGIALLIGASRVRVVRAEAARELESWPVR